MISFFISINYQIREPSSRRRTDGSADRRTFHCTVSKAGLRTGIPFHELQAEQIRLYRKAWADAGHHGEPRVSVSRSIMPLVTNDDVRYFGLRAQAESADQVGHLEGGIARFGKSYIGEPNALVRELAEDSAIAEADTLLLTVPNQLGVDYNATLLESVVKYVAPELGWR